MMNIESNPLYQLCTFSVPKINDREVNQDLNNLANNHFDQIKSESSHLNSHQAKWLSDKLQQLKPYLREENRILFKELINQLASISDVATDSFETLEVTQMRDLINEAIFEDGLDRWLHDESVKGDKAEAVRRIKEAYNNRLTSLDLSELGLTSLPHEIGNLTKLTILNLSKNNLQSLPLQIGNLTLLERLCLSKNKLQTLPSEIWNLTQLTTLSLEYNQLQSLPSEIGSLTQLTELNLSINQLKTLPPQIGNLSQLKKLNLSDNQLTPLPPQIWNLTQLTELNLSINQLKTLPPQIENLSRLTTLVLYNNELQSLPPQIGNLTQLTELYLWRNELQSLPAVIGNLTRLTVLFLTNIKLQTLPPEIGNLTLLTRLDLRYNKLQSLPPQIGNLTQLTELALHENPTLRELPMTLGNIPGITHLNIENTRIPVPMRDAILASCSQKRGEQALPDLANRLNLWMAFANFDPKEGISLQFITTNTDPEKDLEPHQKRSIYEWLVRLEKAEDFKYNQQSLAQATCKILATLKENKEFKELFFIQIVPNLVRCEDRASMAFNEIYVAWRLHTMNPESSTKEKLQEMKGLVKTLVLRKEIAKKITLRNLQETVAAGRKVEEGESVEIYLYYESQLKEKLGLITAIRGMSHEEIGERGWIQEDDLEKAVEDGYLDEMVELPQIQKLTNEADDFQKPIENKKQLLEDNQKLTNDASEELDRLDPQSENYQNKVDEIQNRVKRQLKGPVHLAQRKWVEKHLLG